MGKFENFFELIFNRRMSFEFSDKKIPDEKIEKILEAGRWSSSFHNVQPWSFILIKDKKTVEELMALGYYGSFYGVPKVAIAIVLEPLNLDKQGLGKGNIKEFLEHHQYMSISIPAMNMCYGATCLGIGSCLISSIDKKVEQILKVPKTKKVVLIVGLGYEKEGAYHPPRERKEMKNILYYEKYGEKNE